jgi:hypothetical protein
MAEPMAAEINPTEGPRRMLVMNMAIGAKVIVESGGGIGIAIIVVTAIKAAIIDVKATILLREVVSFIWVFTFFPPPVLSGSGSKGRQRFSRPLSRVKIPAPQTLKGIMLFSGILIFLKPIL